MTPTKLAAVEPPGPAIPPALAQELDYTSGVDAQGSAAASNWWLDQSSFPRKWGGAAPGSPGGVIAYSFYPDYYWNAADQARIAAGLALWSAVTNIQFVEVPYNGTTPAPVTFYYRPDETTLTGTVGYAVGNGLSPGTIGTLVTGGSFFDPPQIGLDGPLSSFTDSGGYGVDTILHEEGHLLGLGGTGPYNETVDPATQQYGPYDSRLWSVMSYINPADPTAYYHSYYPYPGANWGRDSQGYAVVPTTWMPLDILAIQRLYGMPTQTPLSGGQTFGFHCNIAGPIEPFFDFTVNQRPVVTVWDEGGGNTLDLSGFSTPSTVDLRPGTFSSADGMTDNIAIAFDTAVDTAVGGPGNDQFTVNGDSDTIIGGGGQDTVVVPTADTSWVYNGSGANALTSGSMSDSLSGIGTIAFAGGGDTVVAKAGGSFGLGGGGNEIFLGVGAANVALGGGDTAVGGPGPVTVTGAAVGRGDLVWDTDGPLTYVGAATPDTVIAGAATISAGSAGLAAYCDGSSLVFQGGAGSDVAVGGIGRLGATGGSGTAMFVGGSAGDNNLSAGTGTAVVFAGGAGDVITFANAAADVAVLRTGAETVQGAGNSAGFSVYTEGADAAITGGSGNDGFVLGSGSSTVDGGGGINAFVFINGESGGQDVIQDWDSTRDFAFLIGYGAGAAANAVAAQVRGPSGTVVTLPDHTRITFAGLASVGNGSFW